jgi:monoamine oxidase
MLAAMSGHSFSVPCIGIEAFVLGLRRLAIIGAGPGGLMAAYELQKCMRHPIQVTIYEASSRIGGKIQTLKMNSGALYEAGAAEFYDYSQIDEDPLRDLIDELGLSITRMEGSGVLTKHGAVVTQDDYISVLGPRSARALLDFDRQARDWISPKEFYSSDGTQKTMECKESSRFDEYMSRVASPCAREYLTTLIHSDLAAEPCQTNIEYGLQNYVMNHPSYMELYSIEGGNEKLPQELAKRIQAITKLEHRVETVVATGSQGVRLGLIDNGERHHAEYDAVIVALPLNHLKGVHFADDTLADGIKNHLVHYDHPAQYLRVTIQFRTPFWRQWMKQSFTMHHAFGGCCLYDESIRHPGKDAALLGWLIAGDNAKAMMDLSDADCIHQVLSSLPNMDDDLLAQVMDGRVHRWKDAVNAMPGGSTPRSLLLRHQPVKSRPQVYLVGDYLYDSTLNGVLDAATNVAHWIAAQHPTC